MSSLIGLLDGIGGPVPSLFEFAGNTPGRITARKYNFAMGAVANSTRVRSNLSQKSCASYERPPTRMTSLPTPLSEVHSDSSDTLGQNSSASHEIPPAQMSTLPWPLSERRSDSPDTRSSLCVSPSPSNCTDLRDPSFQNVEKNSDCVPSEERTDLCDPSLPNCDGDVVRVPSEERTDLCDPSVPNCDGDVVRAPSEERNDLCDPSVPNCDGEVVRVPSLPAGERTDLRDTVLHSSEQDVTPLAQTAPTRPPVAYEAAVCYTQSIYRMKRERSKYLMFRSVVISLQCAYRCNAARTVLAGMRKASKYINTLQKGNHQMKKEMGNLTTMLEAQSQVLHIKNEVMELLRKEGGQQIAGLQTELQKENIQLKSEMITLKTMIEAQLQTINEKALNIEDVRKKDEETLALRSQLLNMEAELKIEKMSRADIEDMRRKDEETLALRSQLLSMEAELKIEKMSRADIEDMRRKDDETLALRHRLESMETELKNEKISRADIEGVLESIETEFKIEKMSRADIEDVRKKAEETLALRTRLEGMQSMESMETELIIEKTSCTNIPLKTVAEAQIPTINEKTLKAKKETSKRNEEVQAIRRLASLEAEVRIEKMSRNDAIFDDAIDDDFCCLQEDELRQETEIFGVSSIDASFRRIDKSYHRKRKFALEHIESLLVAATSDSGDLEFNPQSAQSVMKFPNSMDSIENTSDNKKSGITDSLQMFARSFFVDSLPVPSSFDWEIKEDNPECDKDKLSAADWTRDHLHAFQNMSLECKILTDETTTDPWLTQLKKLRGMCAATAEFTEFRSVVADTLSNIAATLTTTRGNETEVPPGEADGEAEDEDKEAFPVAKIGDSFFVMRKRSDGQMYLGLNSTTPQNPTSS